MQPASPFYDWRQPLKTSGKLWLICSQSIQGSTTKTSLYSKFHGTLDVSKSPKPPARGEMGVAGVTRPSLLKLEVGLCPGWGPLPCPIAWTDWSTPDVLIQPCDDWQPRDVTLTVFLCFYCCPPSHFCSTVLHDRRFRTYPSHQDDGIKILRWAIDGWLASQTLGWLL